MFKVERVGHQWRVTDSETGQAYRMNRVGDVFVEDDEAQRLLDDWDREPRQADEAASEMVRRAVTGAGYTRRKIAAGVFVGESWWSSHKAD